MRAIVFLIGLPAGLLIVSSGLYSVIVFGPALLCFLILKGLATDSDQAAADTDPIKPYGPYGIMLPLSRHPRNRNRS